MQSGNASISIAGKLKRSDIPRLAEAIHNDYGWLDWDHVLSPGEAEDAILDAADEKLALQLTGSNVPWAEFDELEKLCEELGLPYARECEAGCDWGAHVVYFNPEWDEGKTHREWGIAGCGDEPSLTLSEIRQHLKDGTLVEQLDLMKSIHDFKFPLEIVEVEMRCGMCEHRWTPEPSPMGRRNAPNAAQTRSNSPATRRLPMPEQYVRLTKDGPVTVTLPADPDGMNDKRAGWAAAGIAAYRSATDSDPDYALADLLGDLMHWADRNGRDFDRDLERARHHYAAETTGGGRFDDNQYREEPGGERPVTTEPPEPKTARAADILLGAIAQARDEGEEIPDWLDEAEDQALAAEENA